MRLSDLRVLVAEDEIMKFMDIKKALKFNGISDIISVENQEAVWEEIEKETDKKIDLIVTDMHYPIHFGQEADCNAGFILLEEMEKKGLKIPIIICSSVNYREPKALGCVWYNPLSDLEFDFKEVLQRLK